MKTLRQIKRIVIFVVGMTVLLVGVALIVLPGPAFIVIPAGLGILAIEFEWARRWLRNARDWWREAGQPEPENPSGKLGWIRRWTHKARALSQKAFTGLRASKRPSAVRES